MAFTGVMIFGYMILSTSHSNLCYEHIMLCGSWDCECWVLDSSMYFADEKNILQSQAYLYSCFVLTSEFYQPSPRYGALLCLDWYDSSDVAFIYPFSILCSLLLFFLSDPFTCDLSWFSFPRSLHAFMLLSFVIVHDVLSEVQCSADTPGHSKHFFCF